MDQIPVTFTYLEKEYKGTLDEIAGTGAQVWHLMVGRDYWGRLRQVGDIWYFDESKDKVPGLVDHLAATVIAWYQ